MANDAPTMTSGPGSKVVETTLRLRADSGNAAIANQLFEQINGAVHKAFQEVEQVGGQLVTKANGWVKSAGDTMGPVWNRMVVDAKQANAKVSSGLQEVSDSYHNVASAAASKLKPIKTIATRPLHFPFLGMSGSASTDHQSAEQPERMAAGAGGKEKATSEGILSTGSHGIQFAKTLALWSAPNAKVAEERKKTFENVENAYSLVEHGSGIVSGVRKLAANVRGIPAAAAPAAAGGAEAGTAAGGLAALGDAAFVGTAAVGGLLLHDGVKLLAGKIGILGGNFDTLTGTVMDWYGSVKRSAELEKQITGLEEAHKAYREQMRERQETPRASFEGRERIDDSRAYQKDLARLDPLAEHFEKRFSDADKAGTPRELEQLQRANARDDERLVKDTYQNKFREKQEEMHQAIQQANSTLQANLKNPTRRAVTFLGQPTVHDNRIDAEGQKKIDEQEAEQVSEGFWHGLGTPYRKVAGWFGYGKEDDTKNPDGTQKPLAGYERGSKSAYEKKSVDTTVPDATPQSVDLQPQLSQQEHSLKLANQLRDIARERTTELQNQLQTMSQQVVAAQQQKAAAQQQLKAEQERTMSQKANMSMLTTGQQSSAANILKKFNETKHLSRADALTLQKLGITQGAIGREINKTLAQGLDPELAKQFKAAGGEEDLDKAQQRLTETTSDLADAQAQAKETLQQFREALAQSKDAAATATSAQEAVESTRAKIGGYQDPTGGRGEQGIVEHKEASQQVKVAVEGARHEVVAAIHEMGDTITSVLGDVRAELRGAAQRIKEAQT